MNPRELLSYCTAHTDAMVQMLRAAVEIESPSDSRVAVSAMARFWAREFRRAGGKIAVHEHPRAGCAVTAEFWPTALGRKPVLLLGHTDTVWRVGTLSRMPFRLTRGRASGPGVLDMKSGLVIGTWAIRALRANRTPLGRRVRFFLNPDEETGSLAFRTLLLAEARRAHACLVLEPAAGMGAVKTSRKGVGVFTLSVHGRSAHAGIDPSAGINAISELARQIARIEALARPARGLTISTGLVAGGTRSNVVPDSASMTFDVRIRRPQDGVWIGRKLRILQPVNPGARLELSGGINRPPMERRHAVALFQTARSLAEQLGFELREASTGGGSDGSFAAALGIPTLDGLGGVGGGAHAASEHVLIRELPRRAALLAALLATL